MYRLAKQNTISLEVKRRICFLGLFFLIFPPHVIILGTVFKLVYVFIFIPAVLGFYTYLKKGKKNVIVGNMLLFMFIGGTYLTIVSGFGLFQDTSALSEMVKGVIILFACYYFVDVYQRIYGDRFLVHLLLDLNKVGVIHAVLVILTFVSPEFKTFMYEFISVTDKSMKYLFGEVQGYRYQGIVVSGFSFLSTTHALLFVVGVWGYYMDYTKYGIVRLIYFFTCQFILVASIGLIGRTGFVVIVIFLGMFILWQLSATIRRFRLSKKTIKLLSVVAVLNIVIASGMLYAIDFDEYTINLRFAFEFIYNWMETGHISTSSTQQLLQNEFFLPDNLFNLMFGTANFGRSDSHSYIYSDVGWVLFIYGAGIIGMLVAFSFYFVGLYYTYIYRKLNTYVFIFSTAYIIMLLVLNLKDYYFISHSGYSQIYFLMICAFSVSICHYRFRSSS